LVPGLWIAPYCIGKDTDVAKNHPDWLLHKPDGSLHDIDPAHQAQAQYILDVTHPEARKWFHDLFKTITTDWGYDFIKTDFVEWTILTAQRYHDPAATKSRAYRLGVQTMREAMGPTRHMLDCGPGPEVVGLLDSMRIELDRPPESGPLWNQYIGHYNSTAPAVARRYYFHNRTWINDADHLRLAGLSLSQAQCAATITSLSGGNMISGDRLDTLDPERMSILKKVLPAFPQGARPLDLFERVEPEVFAFEVKKPTQNYWILALFNWSKSPRERDFPLYSLGLNAPTPYLLHEFWTQQLIQSGDPLHLTQPPMSVSLFAIHPQLDRPQVIGTDRHTTQGAVELADIQWEAKTRTLSGVCSGSPGMTWTLTIHVPPAFTPDEKSAVNLTHIALESSLLRARPTFKDSTPMRWSIQFK
jgi:alpha-galactosidase